MAEHPVTGRPLPEHRQPGPPTPVATDGLSSKGLLARSRILAAAADDLAESGGIEVARVAARAGVSDGLPYRYFGNRSGLVAAVVEDFHLRLSEAVVYHDFAGTTWQEREQQRVAAWVRFLYWEPLAPVMLSGLGGDPTVAVSWQRRLHLAVEVGARNIERGQRDGDLPGGNDPMILAAAVLGGVQSAVAVALAADPRPPEKRVASELWRFVLGAATAPVPQARRGRR
jgi:AcrR family transcriptional regulator